MADSSSSYSPLPTSASASSPPPDPSRPRRPSTVLLAALSAVALIAATAGILSGGDGRAPERGSDPATMSGRIVPPASALPRGVKEGVSAKSSPASAPLRLGLEDFAWTNEMLDWQRTGFHFQPEKNWMNDPNGPVFYKGWYHLFYQYNPDSAVWGNITWGHAVSRDLVRWLHLPLAMVPDRWYDINGVWTGSATTLPGGQLVMLYTGATNEMVQVQCLAVPADPSDPLLLKWTKSDANPVLLPPPGVGLQDFRDPTTAWFDPSDSTWRIVIGSKRDPDHAGIALVYKTTDFAAYELVPGVLHAVPGTGMWECIDFFPVAVNGSAAILGMDLSVNGPGVKHVMKASMDDDRHDYYAIGTYDAAANTWVPDDEEADVGLGLRYDWGKFYAAKTFYDQGKQRRILWGWIGETDSERADMLKGWASLQGVPRTVLFDTSTGSNLVMWPVEEVDTLRVGEAGDFGGITIDTGSAFPLDVSSATQLDIVAEFEINKEAVAATVEADIGYNCSTSGGAAGRGALGPFGLLVLADADLAEQTAVYFYVGRGVDGQLRTHFCQDETRSSRANDIVKRVVGSTVPVLHGETLSVRVLVDHSIVESFAQGGRSCITSRVYPTRAIYNNARVFLFNNATGATVTAKTLQVWEMNSTFSHPYPL